MVGVIRWCMFGTKYKVDGRLLLMQRLQTCCTRGSHVDRESIVDMKNTLLAAQFLSHQSLENSSFINIL